MVRLDVSYIFAEIGGPKALHDALTREWPAAGLRYATVQMWQQRHSISNHWQVPVLYVVMRKLGVSPLVCMTDDEELAAAG